MQPTLNLVILVHDRPVLTEAVVHALMRNLDRGRIQEIVLLQNDPSDGMLKAAEMLAGFYGFRRVLYPYDGVAWNTGNAMNHCLQEFPADIYIKVDDDVFVTHNAFVDRMLSAALSDPGVGASIPIMPVNQFMGFHCIQLLGLEEEFRSRFKTEWNTHWCDGTIGRNPELSQWLWEHTLDLRVATEFFIERSVGYLTSQERLSIGSVCFTHELWSAMGGFGPNQEGSLTDYIQGSGLHYAIDTANPAFHFGYIGCHSYLMEHLFPRLLRANWDLVKPPAGFSSLLPAVLENG